MFDKDNSGTISAEEIKAVLSKCGEKLDEAEVDEMIKRADLDGDGLISYEGRLCPLISSEIGTPPIKAVNQGLLVSPSNAFN